MVKSLPSGSGPEGRGLFAFMDAGWRASGRKMQSAKCKVQSAKCKSREQAHENIELIFHFAIFNLQSAFCNNSSS
jgi:hypothetical protein